MRLPHAALCSLLCGLLCSAVSARSAQAQTPASAQPLAQVEVVTVTARRMLDVDSGQILPDPFIRIEGGVITQVRKRNDCGASDKSR